eukprot:4554307-Amphidinium_carterae.1
MHFKPSEIMTHELIGPTSSCRLPSEPEYLQFKCPKKGNSHCSFAIHNPLTRIPEPTRRPCLSWLARLGATAKGNATPLNLQNYVQLGGRVESPRADPWSKVLQPGIPQTHRSKVLQPTAL